MRTRNSNRDISVLKSTRKLVISRIKNNNIEPEVGTCGENESDTNTNTCYLGTNFIPLSYTNRMADVYPYNSSYKPMTNVPIVSGGTAYDHSDGNTYILVFHEALYYGKKLEHSLINPNQIRHNGLEF